MPGRPSPLSTRCVAALAAAVAGSLLLASAAAAQIPASLKTSCERRDAADDATANGFQLPYYFCDDGVPGEASPQPVGGRFPNPGAVKAVPVPQRYAGYVGLPNKVAAQPNSGADASGNIALDVDLTFPDPQEHAPPASGYPLVVFMHGCCSGNKTSWEADTIDAAGNPDDPEDDEAEKWHYSNAWYAGRGYAVLTYTARGFVNREDDGSTGETQLDHRRFEMNDFQHLAGQVADDSFDIGGEEISIDPRRIVATGGSYGGGFSWMALTDPTWSSPGEGIPMRLAAVAPRYGWTDLAYSLVPNGTHLRDRLPAFDGSDSKTPLGYPKQSIIGGLFLAGTTGVPPDADHATFPPAIHEAFRCTQTEPGPENPLCRNTIRRTLPSFIRHRSAYYQNRYFARLGSDEAAARVPIFSAGTFTDPLFTSTEHRRMVDRVLRVEPRYPVQEYYGDYQHFTNNKRKEWSDLCGHEVCEYRDYPNGDLDRPPRGFTRLGVNTRLNRFVDHYLEPPSNPSEPEPEQDVTASLQICPENATPRFPEDEPGPRFREETFDELAPRTLRLRFRRDQRTTFKADPNPHAINSDPVENLAEDEATGSGFCTVETSPAGPGVATYTARPLERRYTMIGRTRVRVEHTGTGQGLQLNARLYDVFPDGRALMVDRGVRRVAGADGTTVFDLHGNGWRFPRGHRVRIELAQDDAPYIKSSTEPSSLMLSRVELRIPVRERTPRGGEPEPPGGPPGSDGPPGPGDDPPGNDGDDPDGGSGGDGDVASARELDCPDLTNAQERAVFEERPDDPFNLDADDDGVPCEDDGTAATAADGELPFTGLGLAALLLVGAVLLVGGYAVRRASA